MASCKGVELFRIYVGVVIYLGRGGVSERPAQLSIQIAKWLAFGQVLTLPCVNTTHVRGI